MVISTISSPFVSTKSISSYTKRDIGHAARFLFPSRAFQYFREIALRILIGLWFALTISLSAAQSNSKREAKQADLGPRQGIKTPGVQIPFARLKAEAELPLAPHWLVFSDTVLIPNKTGGLERLDAKTNKLVDPVAGVTKLCGGATTAFASLWIPACETHALMRFDAKIAADPKALKTKSGGRGGGPLSEAEPPADSKPAAPAKLAEPVKIDSGVGAAVPAVAANADSVWILSDDKTTLSRVDPDQNRVVSELRIPGGCNTLTFGEAALWVTCPSENKVIRINPETTLVEKRIEVSPQPGALAIGMSSLWVLCLKDGKVERIDPKTNKVTKTIETGVFGASTGGIAIGQGSVWVTLTGFPITRIDPITEKVAQQFWGTGGGAIQFGQGSLWLTNIERGTLWRIDPKRILATLAE
jgi:virginiamycin B lyase